MSQHIDYEVALGLKKGDILYHNILEFNNPGETEKFPATCVVTGRVKRLHGVEGFALPVRRLYGDGADTRITRMSRDLWRTEKERVRHVTKAKPRSVVTPAEEPTSDNEKEPVARVRRTRTVAPAPVRVRRTR